MTVDIQKSKRVRISKFIIGGILVGFAVYRFLNIANISPIWATYPGLAVLIIGIINILKGILSKGDSKMTRAIETSIGIIGIAVGVFVKAYISDTTASFTFLISIFLIIQGVGFIATGITQSAKSKAIRIPKIMIGSSIMVVLTGTFFEFHDLPIKVITILLSINILIIGIEVITSAISRKTVKSSSP
ncbi:MAG: hypothetical protein D4R90_05415 [Nitrosopumilales archaeon]|nr:MAG: hypothetical protein D4R90_05415 [Nitrosopumilales archaeon]